MLSLLVFIIILAVLVLIHEFGHFIVAKKNGILVEEFGFGFPPRLWSKKIGETIYSFNAIPLGGFVKLYGEEYNEQIKKNKTRAFSQKAPWQKFLVIIAGVVMNTLLAIGIYYGLLFANNYQSEPLLIFNNFKFTFGQQQGKVIVANVIQNSPAEKAGITTEDALIKISSPASNSITITSANQMIQFVKNKGNQQIVLELENIKNGKKKIVAITPLYDEKLKRSIIGANLVDAVVINYSKPEEKFLSGILHSYNILNYNIKTIGTLFSSSIKEKKLEPVSQAVSGPIGIFSVISDLIKTSGEKFFINLLNVMALLSLSLAMVNVLPFPALDGGRLVFVVYEWITKKQVNQKIEQYVNLAGFSILILMAILVTINDIIRLIK